MPSVGPILLRAESRTKFLCLNVRYRGIWWRFLDLESLGLEGLEIDEPLDHFGERGTAKI
jgi:hypothetical protein